MSSLITSAIIAKETLIRFENNLVLARDIDWQYNDVFGKETAQIGNTYTLRRPVMVTTQKNNMSWIAGNASVTETKVTLVLDSSLTSPLSFTEGDKALKIEKFADRFLKSVVAKMAADLDSQIADTIVNSSAATLSATSGLDTNGLGLTGTVNTNAAGYAVGAYGTALTPSTFSYARKVLADQACPEDGEIYAVLSTSANRQLVLAQATLFNTLTKIDDTYRKGFIGQYDGMWCSQSQSLVKHTNGAQATLAVTAGNATSGWTETAALTVTATGAAIKAGDVFQFPGVFLVNPLSKAVTDVPFQVQVLADYNSGATSVTVSPAPISAGPYQNISATVNGVTAQLTGASLPEVAVVGSAAVGLGGVESLVFHKSAIAAASPALPLPKKAVESAEIIANDEIDGFRLRFLSDYDTIGASGSFGGGVGTGGPGWVNRLDGIYGIKVTNPAWICRIRC